MFTIEDTPLFLRVTFSGDVGERLLFMAIDKITTHASYPDKNDLWLFHGCSSSFSHASLYGLVRAIENSYPKSPRRNKTALVTSTAMHKALAELFLEEAVHLPYTIRAFSDQHSAESWLLQP
jgi:hypothetical protein